MNAIDSNGKTALMLVAEKVNLEMVRYLVGQGAEVNAIDSNGKTALMLAVWMGNLEMVRYLVDQGADINATDLDNRTVLQIAESAGNDPMTYYLRLESRSVETLKSMLEDDKNDLKLYKGSFEIRVGSMLLI